MGSEMCIRDRYDTVCPCRFIATVPNSSLFPSEFPTRVTFYPKAWDFRVKRVDDKKLLDYSVGSLLQWLGDDVIRTLFGNPGGGSDESHLKGA